jgi:hypothetical protein
MNNYFVAGGVIRDIGTRMNESNYIVQRMIKSRMFYPVTKAAISC